MHYLTRILYENISTRLHFFALPTSLPFLSNLAGKSRFQLSSTLPQFHSIFSASNWPTNRERTSDSALYEIMLTRRRNDRFRRDHAWKVITISDILSVLCAKRCSELSTLELFGSSAVHFLLGSGELVSSRNCCLRDHWLVITGSKSYLLAWPVSSRNCLPQRTLASNHWIKALSFKLDSPVMDKCCGDPQSQHGSTMITWGHNVKLNLFYLKKKIELKTLRVLQKSNMERWAPPRMQGRYDNTPCIIPKFSLPHLMAINDSSVSIARVPDLRPSIHRDWLRCQQIGLLQTWCFHHWNIGEDLSDHHFQMIYLFIKSNQSPLSKPLACGKHLPSTSHWQCALEMLLR